MNWIVSIDVSASALDRTSFGAILDLGFSIFQFEGRRSRHSLARLRSNLLRILLSSDEEIVPKSALASIIAGSDLVHHYTDLLQEREKIQSLRKRPDREIFRLFGRPFQVSHFDPRYEELQRKLVRAFGLEELFGERYDSGADR